MAERIQYPQLIGRGWFCASDRLSLSFDETINTISFPLLSPPSKQEGMVEVARRSEISPDGISHGKKPEFLSPGGVFLPKSPQESGLHLS